jgi:hypothetical protein
MLSPTRDWRLDWFDVAPSTALPYIMNCPQTYAVQLANHTMRLAGVQQQPFDLRNLLLVENSPGHAPDPPPHTFVAALFVFLVSQVELAQGLGIEEFPTQYIFPTMKLVLRKSVVNLRRNAKAVMSHADLTALLSCPGST